eukprot:scaffold1931_cov215-Ochromonas_danica.AAC.6
MSKLLDFTSLKDLLARGNGKKKSAAAEELISSIIEEETSKVGRRVKVVLNKRGRKKARKRTNSSSPFERPLCYHISNVEAKLRVHNNVYEYASLLDIPRESVDCLERKFAECRKMAQMLEERLPAINKVFMHLA